MKDCKLFCIVFNLIFLVAIISNKCLNAEAFTFTSQEITKSIFERMIYSWSPDAPVPLEDLRCVIVSHYDFNGWIKEGEIIVHKAVVEDLKFIFKKLFEIKFPIESIKIIDEFKGSDLESMQANNTSAFYARKVVGTQRWSNHSFGTAIDINPLINPYSKENICLPKEGIPYLDRTLKLPGMITEGSFIYKLFKMLGWEWGGECFYERDKVMDRHHFQKVIPGLNKNTN